MKVVCPSLQIDYKLKFNYCEPCAKLLGKPLVKPIELHHICGGDGRTDEWWNFICVCNLHHQYGTTHNLIYGENAKLWNIIYFAIKLLKVEILEERLQCMLIFDEVSIEALKICDSKTYNFGLLSGYYER